MNSGVIPTRPARLSSTVGFSVSVPIGWSGFTWTFPHAASHRQERNTGKSRTNRDSGLMTFPAAMVLFISQADPSRDLSSRHGTRLPSGGGAENGCSVDRPNVVGRQRANNDEVR